MKRAFTLFELLVVMAVMALVASLSVPAIKAVASAQTRFSATPAMLAADLRYARQRAIADRRDTWVVFYHNPVNRNGSVQGVSLSTNLQPFASWCVVQLGRAADQPGRGSWRQVTEWRRLPDRLWFNPLSFVDNQQPFSIPAWSRDHDGEIMPLPTMNVGSSAFPGVGFRGGSGALLCAPRVFLPVMAGRTYWQLDGSGTDSAYIVIAVGPEGLASVQEERAK